MNWDDIDFETALLYVRRNVARMTGVGLIEKEPKSKAGRRKFTLPRVVLEVLKEHREKQHQSRMKKGAKWEEKGLVFCNTYGKYFHASNMRLKFKSLLRKADLPDVRFHDLRHSVATLLLVAKVDLKVVSELLGHSSVAITADIYQSVLPEQWKEVVDKMDDFFKRP